MSECHGILNINESGIWKHDAGDIFAITFNQMVQKGFFMDVWNQFLSSSHRCPSRCPSSILNVTVYLTFISKCIFKKVWCIIFDALGFYDSEYDIVRIWNSNLRRKPHQFYSKFQNEQIYAIWCRCCYLYAVYHDLKGRHFDNYSKRLAKKYKL